VECCGIRQSAEYTENSLKNVKRPTEVANKLMFRIVTVKSSTFNKESINIKIEKNINKAWLVSSKLFCSTKLLPHLLLRSDLLVLKN